MEKLNIKGKEYNNICVTCGTRYKEITPAACAICEDERQYVPMTGQQWTSYAALAENKTIRINQRSENLFDLKIMPAFAIGQKAYLITSPEGNLLWDCIPHLDEATVNFINSKGGLKGIAISHPHYYSLMTAWAATFNCPVYIHEADKKWIMDDAPSINLWNGEELSLWNDMKVIHTGGHFAGSTVLHAPHLSDKGSLLVGDTLQIAPSLQFISMMYSYPNVIPLPLNTILHIYNRLQPLQYDTMYGAFEWQTIAAGAKQLFQKSVDVYRNSVSF